jgi:hypothetical protein
VISRVWDKISWDPHQEIQGQWTRCKKHWDKINKIMKDVGLPEFCTPDHFIDLSDLVKLHAELDALWTKEFSIMVDARPGKVRQFAKNLIRALTMLQQLNFSLVKYQAHAVDIKGIYAVPMEQHIFPWAQTCENLFFSWSEYENGYSFQ